MPVTRKAIEVPNHSLVQYVNTPGILEKDHDDPRYKNHYLLYTDSMMNKVIVFPQAQVEVIDTAFEIVIAHLERYLDMEANQ